MTDLERRIEAAKRHRGHLLKQELVPPLTPGNPDELVVVTYTCSCGSTAITRGGKRISGDEGLAQ